MFFWHRASRFHHRDSRSLVRLLLLLVVCATGLPGCGRPSETARSLAALGSGNLRWASFPVDIRADASLHDGGAAEEDLLAAIAFWEARAGKTLFRLGSWPSGQAPYTGAVTDPDSLVDNVIFFLNPWPNTGDWTSQIAGKTVLISNGGGIHHAVIFLNGETTLCSSLCEGEGESEDTSRRRLIAHELGHFLGFAHVADRHNIMYPEIQPGGSLDDEEVNMELLHRLTE
jgi:hypothetical protein